MKKIFYVLTAIALLAFAACTEEPKYEAAAKLTIVESDLVLPCGGGEGYVVLEDGADLKVETAASWLTASVNGNMVVLTAPANESLESRYSTVTITSPRGTASVTAQQMGTLSVDFSPSDINVSSKGGRFTFPYEHSSRIEATSSVSWISVQTTDKELVVVVSENTAATARTSTVEWKLGGTTGVINVSQKGLSSSRFTVNSNWVPAYYGRTTYEGEEVEVLGVEVKDGGASGKYIITACTESDYIKSGCESQEEFMETFAQESIDYLKQLIAQYPDQFSSLDDLTHTNSAKEAWNLMPAGNYYVYAIGVDASGNASGQFAYAPYTIAGESSGDFKVNSNWSITYNGRYTQTGVEYEYLTYTALADDSYYPVVMSKSQYESQYGSSIANLAPAFANYLKENNAAPKLGTQKLLYNKKDPGEYVAIMIGMDANWNLTSYYAMIEFTVGEEQEASEAYKKWLGEWTLTAKNVAGTADSTYFNFTIVQNSANQSYAVNGWGGDKFVNFGNVVTQFDETTGDMVFRTYNVAEGVDLYSDGRSWDIGLYGDIDVDGTNSPVTGDNLKLATGKLSSDGSKATISAAEVKLTTGKQYTYTHMWWYGFSQDGYYVIYNGTRPPFPCTLTKQRSLGGSSLINVESTLISNYNEKAPLVFRNGLAFVHSL